MTLELVTVSMYFIVTEELIIEVRFSNEIEVGLFSCLSLGFLFALLFIMQPHGNIINKLTDNFLTSFTICDQLRKRLNKKENELIYNRKSGTRGNREKEKIC